MIVAAHQGAACLGACLDSVRAHAPGAEVLVVDNASSDGSADLVRARFPAYRLLENPSNEGFGAACNRAAALAEQPVLLFLNQDAQLTTAIEPALARFAAEPELGVLGARVRYADGRLQLSQGRAYGAAAVVAHWYAYPLRVLRRGAGGALLESRPEAYERAREAPWVSGCCLFARRSHFRDVGGFSADYFLYVEDVDLCTRLRARGARVVFDPAVVAIHAERGADPEPTGLGAFALRHTLAGQAVYLRTHAGRLPALLALAALLPCFAALGTLGGLSAWVARSPRGRRSAQAFRAGAAQTWRSLVQLARGATSGGRRA